MLKSVDFGINRMDAFSIEDEAKEFNVRLEKLTFGEFGLKICFIKFGEDKVKLVKMTLYVFGDNDEVIKVTKHTVPDET